MSTLQRVWQRAQRSVVRFAGKIALIAGGTGALGRAVSRAFLETGATVIVTYQNEREWGD